eukprot:scaffold7016_cov203-Skeletonema_marinoi.AAC.2
MVSRLEATSLFIPGDLVTHGHPSHQILLKSRTAFDSPRPDHRTLICSNNGRASTSCTKRAHYPGDASTDEGKGLCDRHGNKADRGEKMCALSIRSNNTKRPRVNAFFLDLTDVRCPSASPQQQPTPKVLVTASKYWSCFR